MTSEDEAKILQDSAEGWKRANISRVKAEMERYGITIADLRQDVDVRDIVTTTFTNALPPGHPNVTCHVRMMHEPTGAMAEVAGPVLFAARVQAQSKLLDILSDKYGYNRRMVSTTQTPILPAVGYKVAGE